MGGTILNAGILVQWFEMLLLLFVLKISYYGRQWDFIWSNATCNTQSMLEMALQSPICRAASP